MLQRPLDGYAFPVYTIESCPTNLTEWQERSSALNCNQTNAYMCVPNENFTELLEFCYNGPQIRIVKGRNKIARERIYRQQSMKKAHKSCACCLIPSNLYWTLNFKIFLYSFLQNFILIFFILNIVQKDFVAVFFFPLQIPVPFKFIPFLNFMIILISVTNVNPITKTGKRI